MLSIWLRFLKLSCVVVSTALLFVVFYPTSSYAGKEEGNLNIRVRIIQCGSMDTIARACENKPACCVFANRVTNDDTYAEVKHSSIDKNECAPGNFSGGKRGPVFCSNLQE